MPTKDEEARQLANKHYQLEVGISQIFRLKGTADAEVLPAEPIKLLEVNENTVPSGILPLQFDPAPAMGIHFPSVIVEVTPDEFQKIKTQELILPKGWMLGDLIPKPAGNHGGE